MRVTLIYSSLNNDHTSKPNQPKIEGKPEYGIHVCEQNR